MSNDISLIMRIRSIFDGSATAEAKKAADNLGKSAKEAGQSGEQAMNVMSTATAAANGNFEGLAAGVVRLTGRVKLLGMSMMQLSLVAATITLLAKLFQTIAERADAMAAGLRQIKSDNVTAAVTRIKDAYEDMTDAADRAAKARDKTFDLNMQEIDSLNELTLANQELSKSVELRNAKTPEERDAIEARYKSSAAASTQKAESKKAEAQRQKLLDDADKAEAALQAARDQRDALKSQAERRVAQTFHSQSLANKASGEKNSWGYALSLGQAPNKGEGEANEASKGRDFVEGLIKDIKALDATITELSKDASDKRYAATIVNNKQTASGLTYEAGTISAAAEAERRDAKAKVDAERARIQEEIEALEERKAALAASRGETKERLSFRANAEQSEANAAASAATRMAGHDYGQAAATAAREAAEARAAIKAVESYAAETTKLMRELEAAMKSQRAALRNIPNS